MSTSKEILNYFDILKKRNSLGTSYLFVGEDIAVVYDIIKTIGCEVSMAFCGSCWDCKKLQEGNHPDLFIAQPQGLTLKIETIRQAIQFLFLKSFKLKKKFVIIKDAHTLSQEAANAFLKTLEEPPKNSFIGVCSSKLQGLLPTIVSRCRKIFLPLQDKEANIPKDSKTTNFLQGKYIEFKDRKEFANFLWSFARLLHESLISKTSFKNNDLPQLSESEIILDNYDITKISDILGDTLKIYSVCKNININLGLNLIKMKLH